MRKRWMTGAAAILLPAVMLLSCGGGDSDGGETALADGSGGDVLAVVSGQDVTRAEVEEERARLFRQFGGQVSPFQAAEMESVLTLQAMDNLVNKILLSDAVDQDGDRLDEAEVQSRFDEFMTQFPDSAAFQQAIVAQGWESQEAFFTEFRRMMEIDALLESKAEGHETATEQEIADFYADNKERFLQEEQVNARHILIMFEEGDTEEAKAAKREEIDAVLRQIRGGADFAALAQEHSDCPSKANGGDLGWFGRNRMVKPFEDVAFTLPVGKVSDVVETRFGYHVIEVLQKRDAKQLPLEEVRAGIEEQLNQQHRKERIDDYLLELRGDADIVYNEPLQVAPVGGDAPPPPPQ